MIFYIILGVKITAFDFTVFVLIPLVNAILATSYLIHFTIVINMNIPITITISINQGYFLNGVMWNFDPIITKTIIITIGN